MRGDAQLQLEGGAVRYGQVTVLEGVDFHVDAGEFVVLLGANGSGKSTLVRALLGLVPLSAGTLRLYGVPIDRFHEWSRIGYVPQRVNAVAGVPATVGEVVASGTIGRRRLFGSSRDDDAVDEALSAVDMLDLSSSSVNALSGGQQQRVLIARALVGKPDILVLDEPVSGVDLEHQSAFAQTIGDLHRAGHSVLLVAHALGFMEPLVGRAVVLSSGRVTYDGPPSGDVHDSHVHHHPSGTALEGASHPTGGVT